MAYRFAYESALLLEMQQPTTIADDSPIMRICLSMSAIVVREIFFYSYELLIVQGGQWGCKPLVGTGRNPEYDQ